MARTFNAMNGERCICGARAGYRITGVGGTRFRCPCCANNYSEDDWHIEPLPHIVAEHDVLSKASCLDPDVRELLHLKGMLD